MDEQILCYKLDEELDSENDYHRCKRALKAARENVFNEGINFN